MADHFVPLTTRIGARAVTRREELLDPGFAHECLEALERFGVLVFPEIGLTDEEQVTFSENLGDVIRMGPLRPENVYRHEWKLGDLIIWNNCGVMHRVTPYDPTSGRMMHHTTRYEVERIEGVEGAG